MKEVKQELTPTQQFELQLREQQRQQRRNGLGFRVSLLLVVVAGIAAVVTMGVLGLFRGPSAFEIAVRNGFTGTEAEWVQGLQGTDGRPGQDSDEMMAVIITAYEQALQAGTWTTGQGLIAFIEYHFGDRFQGAPGINTNMVAATDTALRSSVTVRSNFGNNASTGSGVVYCVDSTGQVFIITNFHVVSRLINNNTRYVMADSVDIFFFGMHTTNAPLRAAIIGVSPVHDLAVLRVAPNNVVTNLPVRAADIPSRITPRVGEPVIAVGNPIRLNYGISVTEGIVSNYSQWISMQNLEGGRYPIGYRVFRTSAAVNQGNSGGGMFNASGELIGIVMAKLSGQTGGVSVDNIGYVIPLDIALRVTRQFVERAGEFNTVPLRLRRPVFGMNFSERNPRFDVRPSTGEVFAIADVTIAGWDSPSFNVDTHLAIGDIIREISFQHINHLGERVWQQVTIEQGHHLRDALIDAWNMSPNATTSVRFNIERLGESLQITVPLTSPA